MASPIRPKRAVFLAWMVQAERTYREAVPSEWQVERLDGPIRPRGAPVELSRVIVDEHEVPDLTIEPLRSGAMRFTATFPLLVLRDGEMEPKLEGPTIEVPLGSVVKAGPVLLAPLDRDGARDLIEGDLELPLIAPHPVSPEESRADDRAISMARLAATLRFGRAHRLSLLVAASSVFVAGFVAYKMMVPPLHEGRVLVAMDGLPSGDEEMIRRDLDDRLRAGGLDPVFFDTLVTPTAACRARVVDAEDLEPCARSLGAPQVLRMRMDFASSEEVLSAHLEARVVRLGRARPFPARELDLTTELDEGAETALWGRGIASLEPSLSEELLRTSTGAAPQTPFASTGPL